jgi:hypothetical protein
MLALAVFLLIGGAAFAATHGTSRTIRACYAKKGGKLRIASHCKRSERSLAWNQAGPPGKTGSAGVAGAKGADGARGAEGPQGPSDTYAAGTAFETLSGSYLQAGVLSLPAGSYLVNATATFFAKATGGMLCLLDAEQAGTKTELDGATASASAGSANTLALSGITSLAADATVELRCRLQGGGLEGSIDDAHLTATKVGALHGSLPTD